MERNLPSNRVTAASHRRNVIAPRFTYQIICFPVYFIRHCTGWRSIGYNPQFQFMSPAQPVWYDSAIIPIDR